MLQVMVESTTQKYIAYLRKKDLILWLETGIYPKLEFDNL
jgi:hypothetical protein